MLPGINLLLKNARYYFGQETEQIERRVKESAGSRFTPIVMQSIDGVLKSIDERVQQGVEQAFAEGSAHTLMLVLPMVGFPPLGETWPQAPDGRSCLGCVAEEYGVTREAYRALFKEHEERLEAVKKAFCFSEETVAEVYPSMAKENYDNLFIYKCHFGDKDIAYFPARMLTAQWKKTHPTSCPHFK